MRIRRSLPYLTGLGMGLYLARVLAEATRIAWSLPALSALATVSAIVGLGLVRFIIWPARVMSTSGMKVQGLAALRECPATMWTVFPVWLYVFWPRQDLAVAWAVGLVSLVAWLWQVARGKSSGATHQIRGFANSFFLIAFALYVFTLAPGLQPADGGEFQLVAARFGVAHPPGYPLYSFLGGLFVRVPLGPNPAWRLNLFSAVTAAATLALVSHTGRRITGSATAGLLAALTLGSATTFWATATTASIRPLAAFFTALSLFALTSSDFTFHVHLFHRRRTTQAQATRFTFHVSRATLFAIAVGFGIAHHASLVFMGAVGLIYLLLVDPALLHQPRRWLAPVVALVLTQLVWLYLPLRDAAGAPLAPGNLTTFDGLAQHILARGFAGDMFAFASPEHLPDRLAFLPALLRFQFNDVLLLASLAGALLLLRHDPRRFVLLAGGFALHTFVTLTYRAPQTVEYEMPAYVALALLAGQVGGWARAQGGKWASCKSLVVAAILVGGVFNAASAWPSFRDLSRQDDARQYAESLLRAVPDEGVVLSNWHWATPIWYLQRVEKVRPDIEAIYVAPQGESLAQNWVDAIAEHAGERPTVAVRYFEHAYQALPYRFEPLGSAYVAQAEPTDETPQHLLPLNIDLGAQVRLLGYSVDSAEKMVNRNPALPLGRSIALDLAWMPLKPLNGDVSLFAHLLQDGVLVGQGSDRRHAAAGYQPGQVILDRFLVYPLVGAMPGEVQLAVGAYRPDAADAPRLTSSDGADEVSIAHVALQPADSPSITSRPQRVPMAGGPTLVGVDWDTTIPGQLRLYLHWQGRSHPTTLDTAVRQGDEILARAWVDLPTQGYVSSVYDLPLGTEPLVLTTSARALGSWGLPRDRLPLPSARSGERYVPIGGEMVLLNVTVDKQATLLPGDPLRCDVRLVGTRPLLRDRIVSVSLVGLRSDGSWAWRDLSDSVPALGAIPTLKWVHGSTVLDRHRLVAPPDAASGLATAQLQVYDHYTQAILPPLDLRLLREGLSIPLYTWTIDKRPRE